MVKKLVLTMFLLSVASQTTTSVRQYLSIKKMNKFSEKNLIHHMKELNIVYPDVVLAQAKIETANFTSVIFKENNNLFGMRMPERRKTTAIGVNRKHAKYEDWIQSLVDYKIWQDRIINKTSTKRKYLRYLSQNYAEDKQYINKIETLL